MSLSGQLRSWPMFAALGAGLVLTAVAAGAGGVPAVILVGCGVAALGQGVAGFRAGRVVLPAVTMSGCLVVLAGAAALVLTGGAATLGIAVLPLLAAVVFVLVVAFGAAVELRARRAVSAGSRPGTRVASERTAARLPVIGMLAGAALTAALATPALAATDAGDLAVPHGQLHDGGHSGH